MAKKPKLYLELYYGRLTPDSEPIEGAEGSMLIGPFDCFITTYMTTIRMLYKDTSYAIAMVDDMVFANNMYFSDWAVTAGLPDWFHNHPIPKVNFPEAIEKEYISEF